MAFLIAVVLRALTRRPRAGVALLVLLLVGGPGLRAQTPPSREYQIKAVFLFNFAQFVEWPPAAFAASDAPLRIGILGDDPFGAALDRIVQGEVVRHRRLLVVRSHRVEDLENCQVVFVSQSESPRMAEIIARLSARPILTVSEITGFAQEGGIIKLSLVGGKVRFEINPAAARSEGLRLSSQLLSVGKIVGAETRKENT